MCENSKIFQVFVKPIGSICNLNCSYCYYLQKRELYKGTNFFQMPDILLEEYIVQHIEASTEPEIRFSWHGGEPTLLGVDYFRKIVKLQKKHRTSSMRISNGIQSNGTLFNDEWGEFLASEDFFIGLSLDGPQHIHDKYRMYKDRKPSFEDTMRGFGILKKFNINTDILCVVNSHNVLYPTEIYSFFKKNQIKYISFLPLVESEKRSNGGVSHRTVPPEAFGYFLTTIFNEWVNRDIGKIKVQIFEEASRTAFGQDHSLCIFRRTCGEIPVIEHNGDFFSCDHYVVPEYKIANIIEKPLKELLENRKQREFGEKKLKDLPAFCKKCTVRDMCNGGCPKNRFSHTPDGEIGLNYLCKGYKYFFSHCKPFVDKVAEQFKLSKEN